MSTELYTGDERVRSKIDKLLQKNAALEATLGKDSTVKERVKTKVKQAELFEKIKQLDKEFYEIIVIDDDRSQA